MFGVCFGCVSVQVLCVRNLAGQASVAQLVALFSRFQREGGPPVLYRLLTGRLKGQAFITLSGNSRTHTPTSTSVSLSLTHSLLLSLFFVYLVHTHTNILSPSPFVSLSQTEELSTHTCTHTHMHTHMRTRTHTHKFPFNLQSETVGSFTFHTNTGK